MSRVLVLHGRVTHFVCGFGHGVALLCVLFVVFYLMCAVWSILFGCPVVFGCGWFEWLSAIRAVEILSPVFSWGILSGKPSWFSCLVLDQMA